jgi:8-amino-7-oxononanoate synthase
MTMIDFTSSLYLGFYHPEHALTPWRKFTTGVPAALRGSPMAHKVARRLAVLQRSKRAVLLPSTLHLFWDLFDSLARQQSIFYVDALTYRIALWGLERVRGRGALVRFFTHHDTHMLEALMDRDAFRKKRPVVVTDGFCPGCGRGAPLSTYLALIRPRKGILVLDDTQALGILGRRIPGSSPYGTGGGGSAVWHNVKGDDILVAGSMAKGFGVPLAVLSGSKQMVRAFERDSQTRIHCSPPSNAVLHAATAALDMNRDYGEMLRKRLAGRVRQLRHQLPRTGLDVSGSLFPVQALKLPKAISVARVHRQLSATGIHTVLSNSRHGSMPRIVFILRADHTKVDVATAIGALADIVPDAHATDNRYGENDGINIGRRFRVATIDI